ncbi:hypothetical protein HAX54_029921 [Datura stramonium]|uniref:Uncharacterized protein n=1 Tax=Datura stramonium TaxID=4076 RepID=A0ABS8V9R4_DATST|nr:hypothetical protein [Datura stramonium]
MVAEICGGILFLRTAFLSVLIDAFYEFENKHQEEAPYERTFDLKNYEGLFCFGSSDGSDEPGRVAVQLQLGASGVAFQHLTYVVSDSLCTRVFGVSTDCMQLSFDSTGNSFSTILLMMQGHLYAQGGFAGLHPPTL